MQHSFDINIAQKYDVNVAIFLNNLAFWVLRKKANNKHYFDGHYWVYNTVDAYTVLFPYWSHKQLRTIIKRCVAEGLILEGNYNQSPYDRTKWYTLSKKGLDLFNFPSCPNGQVTLSKGAIKIAQEGQPIPDINTDIDTDNLNTFGKKKIKRKKECDPPPDFSPSPNNYEFCSINNLNCQMEFSKFMERCKSKGIRYVSWKAAFNNWLINALEFKNEREETRHAREQKNSTLFDSCAESLRQFKQECAAGISNSFSIPKVD